jgi:hypothetical protein
LATTLGLVRTIEQERDAKGGGTNLAVIRDTPRNVFVLVVSNERVAEFRTAEAALRRGRANQKPPNAPQEGEMDTPSINAAVVKKQRKSLFHMYYRSRRFKLSHIGGEANEMAFALNLAAEARLPVNAQNTGGELSLWVEGAPDELDAFFKHLNEVRQEKVRKAEALKHAKEQARQLVKQAQAADYSNRTPSAIVAKPKLVKITGECVM